MGKIERALLRTSKMLPKVFPMGARNETGIALRAIRAAAGMSLDQVSEVAGVSVSYLSRAENGLVSPKSQWVQIVCIAIGTELANQSVAA